MFTSPVGNTNVSREQKSCSMKNPESMPHFWNMAGNDGDPAWSVCFIKPLKRKANLGCFTEINLIVVCVFCFLPDRIYCFCPKISITGDFPLWGWPTHISVGSIPEGGEAWFLQILFGNVCMIVGSSLALLGSWSVWGIWWGQLQSALHIPAIG